MPKNEDKRLDKFEKMLNKCSKIQETGSLNSDEIMDTIISETHEACTEYTKEVNGDSSNCGYFRRPGSTRGEQVNELLSVLNGGENQREKVKKIIDTFCELKRRYRANNSYFKSRFLEQLTIHPINYLLQVVSCRYIHDEKIDTNFSFYKILKGLGFPDELCLHFSALESAQHRNFTGAEYVCGLPIINKESKEDFKKYLKGDLKKDAITGDIERRITTSLEKYEQLMGKPLESTKKDRIEKDKQLLHTSDPHHGFTP